MPTAILWAIMYKQLFILLKQIIDTSYKHLLIFFEYKNSSL